VIIINSTSVLPSRSTGIPKGSDISMHDDMLLCMRTTVRIRDDLLRRVKKQAADEGRTVTSLIEEGLAVMLAKPRAQARKGLLLPVSKATGGVLPGVDLNRSADLEEIMGES
jgi:hypothetical protein